MSEGHEGREEKQRIEKEAKDKYPLQTSDHFSKRIGYKAGATSENNRLDTIKDLRDQLAKERQLRKELVDILKDITGDSVFKNQFPNTYISMKALIQKSDL